MNEISLDKNKVVLGLSGGVDSTTAALLLKRAGMDVTGLYFDVKEERPCENDEYIRAEAAAKRLEIPLIYRNVSQEFRDKVVRDFCEEYIAGRTPNPCIVCNPLVKFKVLIDAADEIGAYHIATGHYADIVGGCRIGRAENLKKDQSYMLYRLKEDTIRRIIFPLSGIEDKETARAMLSDISLSDIASAKDSQEICFIDDETGYREFLKKASSEGFCGALPEEKGEYVDEEGNVIGEHGGIINYTVGQRKGLGQAFGKPMFIKNIDTETNRITLCENDALFSGELFSVGNSFPGEAPAFGERLYVFAKIRYAAQPSSAVLERIEDDRFKVTFEEPQRAVTPGQSVVFYDGDGTVLGGGFIRTV